jgi:hypothetical protein
VRFCCLSPCLDSSPHLKISPSGQSCSSIQVRGQTVTWPDCNLYLFVAILCHHSWLRIMHLRHTLTPHIEAVLLQLCVSLRKVFFAAWWPLNRVFPHRLPVTVDTHPNNAICHIVSLICAVLGANQCRKHYICSIAIAIQTGKLSPS